MKYTCELCNYSTENQGNFCHHKKTKKHLEKLEGKSLNFQQCSSNVTVCSNQSYNIDTTKTTLVKSNKNSDKIYVCSNCDFEFKHHSSYYRHKKTCNSQTNESIQELKLKLAFAEKEKELLKKIEKEKNEIIKEKSELLNTFMANANTIINKAQDNTQITAQAMQNLSVSALKYANDKFKDAPALLPLENFKIKNLDYENEEEKRQLTEILVYNAKQKSLDKLLGDHIVKEYKKDDPKEQSFHTTDSSRLNYIVRELIKDAYSWSIDKNGIKICTSIVKPLIDKCIGILLDHQKELLSNMSTGNFAKQEDVQLIINVLMSIDRGSLESDINKYIAPYFNLDKK